MPAQLLQLDICLLFPDVVDVLAIKLIGAVPDDENIVIATNQGEPLVGKQDTLAGKAYLNIVKRILGEEVPLMNLDEGSSFWKRLRTLFRG